MSKAYRPLTVRDGVEGKECAICGVWKVRSKFTRGHYDGLDHRCKPCQAELRAKRRGPSEQDGGPEVRVDFALMTYQGVPVAFTQDTAAICLTDVHRAAGSPANQEPYIWLRSETAEALINQYARENNLTRDQVIRVLRGRGDAGGGTWAPREIALAYAHYLSPALYLACNRFVLSRGQSQQTGLNDAILRAIAEKLGVLPRLEKKIDGLGSKVDEVKDKIDNEPEQWVGQVYIIEIVNPHQLALLWRKFRVQPDDKAHLIAASISAGSSGSTP